MEREDSHYYTCCDGEESNENDCSFVTALDDSSRTHPFVDECLEYTCYEENTEAGNEGGGGHSPYRIPQGQHRTAERPPTVGGPLSAGHSPQDVPQEGAPELPQSPQQKSKEAPPGTRQTLTCDTLWTPEGVLRKRRVVTTRPKQAQPSHAAQTDVAHASPRAVPPPNVLTPSPTPGAHPAPGSVQVSPRSVGIQAGSSGSPQSSDACWSPECGALMQTSLEVPTGSALVRHRTVCIPVTSPAGTSMPLPMAGVTPTRMTKRRLPAPYWNTPELVRRDRFRCIAGVIAREVQEYHAARREGTVPAPHRREPQEPFYRPPPEPQLLTQPGMPMDTRIGAWEDAAQAYAAQQAAEQAQRRPRSAMPALVDAQRHLAAATAATHQAFIAMSSAASDPVIGSAAAFQQSPAYEQQSVQNLVQTYNRQPEAPGAPDQSSAQRSPPRRRQLENLPEAGNVRHRAAVYEVKVRRVRY